MRPNKGALLSLSGREHEARISRIGFSDLGALVVKTPDPRYAPAKHY